MVKAIYARQSVDREDSISVESQIEFCKYELRGESYREYIDKGFSGKDTHRPAFQALLEDIRQGLVETVIVYKLDRISRSILDFATMMEMFQQHNVEFISSTEKFDTSSPIGRAMLNICVVFAQLERETIQKRVADAYCSRSKKGLYMGGRIPYGFRLVDTKISGIKTACYEPVEAEIEQIRLMYSIYARPETSLADIVRYFSCNGIAHLRGKSWNTARISELLRNPIYVQADMDVYDFFRSQGTIIMNDAADFIGVNGCYLYKGDSADRNQQHLRDKHLVLAPHPGAVSSNLWLACRMKCLNNRQSALPRKPKNSWLVGKTKCGICGYALTVRKNKQGGRYFVCSGHHPDRCRGPGTIHAQELEELVSRQIQKKLTTIDALHPAKRFKINPKASQNKLRILQIDEEIQALVQRIGQANGPLVKRIGDRVAGLERERESLLGENLALVHALSHQSLPIIREHAALWARMEFDDRKLVADALIQKVLIHMDSVDILWNL